VSQASTRQEIGPAKKAVFYAILTGFVLLLADLGIALPFLRFRGFYFEPRESESLIVDSASPNNLEPDRRTIWSYAPHSRYRHVDTREGASCDIAINAEGFRDEELQDRAGATFRFVALGDSFTFGWLVQHDDRWDEVLARLLKQDAGIPSASVNLGMWMSTFDQHALVLEDHMPSDADLVVHLVYPSHLQTISRHLDRIQDGRIVEVHDPLLQLRRNRLLYGAVGRTVEKRLTFPYTLCSINYCRSLQGLAWALDQRGSAGSGLVDEKAIYRETGQKDCARGWEMTELAIRQIAAFTKSRGVPYVVVVVPRSLQVSPALWGNESPEKEFLTTSLPQEKLRAICARTDWAHYLDLLPAMRAAAGERLYFRKDPHWRPEGHQLAAELILGYLRDQKLLLGMTSAQAAVSHSIRRAAIGG